MSSVKSSVSLLLKSREDKFPQTCWTLHGAHMESVHSGTDCKAWPTTALQGFTNHSTARFQPALPLKNGCRVLLQSSTLEPRASEFPSLKLTYLGKAFVPLIYHWWLSLQWPHAAVTTLLLHRKNLALEKLGNMCLPNWRQDFYFLEFLLFSIPECI